MLGHICVTSDWQINTLLLYSTSSPIDWNHFRLQDAFILSHKIFSIVWMHTGQFLGFVSCLMTLTCRLSWFPLCSQVLTQLLYFSSICAHVCWVTMLTTLQVWVWFPQWLHLHSPAVYDLWFPFVSSLDCWTALTDFVLMWQPAWPNLAHEEKLTWIQTCETRGHSSKHSVLDLI